MKFGIFFFDDAEPIDVATYGVLSMAKRIVPDVEMVAFAPRAGVVKLANGFKMIADYGIHDNNVPEVDAIVITGGGSWPQIIQDEVVLQFFRDRNKARTTVGAVCTGGFILGATGLLDGKQATTRYEGSGGEQLRTELMAEKFPEINVVHSSLVDQGTVLTGGGVALCIDMMLHLLKRHYGEAVARDIARLLEYQRAWDANLAALPPVGV